MEKKSFGTTKDGQAVDLYTLTNSKGASAEIMTYGATLVQLNVPDKDGKFGNVVLDFDNIKQYETDSPYFGTIAGRVANRIAKGTFTLDGATYHLAINNGVNSLHGGLKGYDKRIWSAEEAKESDGPAVKFSLTDPDGTEGYPGTVKVDVTYTLTDENTLRIVYNATTDKATPINLTNHTYWNLKDGGASSIDDHVLKLFADQYTPVDATQIPTGDIVPVKGTGIDFTTAKPIGQDVEKMDGDPAGYDHNLVIRNHDGSLTQALQIYEPTTGRTMEMWTTEPGFQFYSGNFLDGKAVGPGGVKYTKRHGFAFEAQHYPDSINHPKFPDSVLRPGQTYHQVTEYRFSVNEHSPF